MEVAPPHRHGGRHVPLHLARGQARHPGRPAGPQPVFGAGHRDRPLRLPGPPRLRGCARLVHGEGRVALGIPGTFGGAPPAPGGARVRARGLPGLFGLLVALVHPGLDPILFRPRRRGREVRLHGRRLQGEPPRRRPRRRGPPRRRALLAPRRRRAKPRDMPDALVLARMIPRNPSGRVRRVPVSGREFERSPEPAVGQEPRLERACYRLRGAYHGARVRAAGPSEGHRGTTAGLPREF